MRSTEVLLVIVRMDVCGVCSIKTAPSIWSRVLVVIIKVKPKFLALAMAFPENLK